jgi:hypothetical protein
MYKPFRDTVLADNIEDAETFILLQYRLHRRGGRRFSNYIEMYCAYQELCLSQERVLRMYREDDCNGCTMSYGSINQHTGTI